MKFRKIINDKKNIQGFSLIELIITIIIVGMVAGIGSMLITNVMQSWRDIRIRKEMLFNARVAMNRLVREIRHIDTSNILTHDPNYLSANIIVDAHKFPNPNEVVSFFLQGSDLVRNNAIDVLAHDVQQLQFTYRDANNIYTTDPNYIRKIDIKLTFITDGHLFEYESGAAIRNITKN